MNMILHGNEDADIPKGDTITSPQFTNGDQLRTFDFAVMNPPFSVKSWSNGLENDYGRFEFGRPPEKNGDYAFLLHVLKSLKSTGKAAVIMPHGVLFRGHAEASHPQAAAAARLHQGHHRPAAEPLLRHRHPGLHRRARQGERRRPHRRLHDRRLEGLHEGRPQEPAAQPGHPQDRRRLQQADRDRPLLAHGAAGRDRRPEANDYNLNIPRYIDSSEPEDIQDLARPPARRHPRPRPRRAQRLLGCLPAACGRSCSSRTGPATATWPSTSAKVQQTILDSPEFQKFAAEVRDLAGEWFAAHRSTLAGISPNTRPNDLIATLGDDLLARFKPIAAARRVRRLRAAHDLLARHSCTTTSSWS